MALRDLLTVDDLSRAVVDCPEWSLGVHVRALSLGERTKVMTIADRAWANEAERNAELALWMVIYGAIDSDGTQAFTADDLEALRAKNPFVIERLALKIGELSKIGDAADGSEKNSETTPSDGSSSV